MEKEQDLFERLWAHADGDMYPFHMPGHKRNAAMGLPEQLVKQDITEIENFDNLHHAQGILKDAMRRAAQLYGADRTYFLVNGSTCGILAAISSALSEGDTLILGRNAHISAYHGVYLRGCNIASLYPEYMREYGIFGKVTPEETEQMLKRHPEAKAVMITSPTYEGAVSDVAAIAALVHAYDKLLIVDEAHGAHFGLDPRLPRSGVQSGADIVIHSLHKTLPSLTQTALLHINGDRVNWKRLERFLRIYQSSSPSYLLMASIDRCIGMLAQSRGQWFDTFFEKRAHFMQKASALKKLTVVSQTGSAADFDPGKLLIVCDKTDLSGRELQRLLYEKYHLQMEMAGENSVLAILTVADTQEGWERLADALLQIDESLRSKELWIGSPMPAPATEEKAVQPGVSAPATEEEVAQPAAPAPTPAGETVRMTIAEAIDRCESEPVELKKTKGRIVTEYVYAYPPGIPFILPGEEMSEQVLEQIRRCRAKKLEIQGTEDETVNTIRCVRKQDPFIGK